MSDGPVNCSGYLFESPLSTYVAGRLRGAGVGATSKLRVQISSMSEGAVVLPLEVVRLMQHATDSRILKICNIVSDTCVST